MKSIWVDLLCRRVVGEVSLSLYMSLRFILYQKMLGVTFASLKSGFALYRKENDMSSGTDRDDRLAYDFSRVMSWV